MRWWIRRAMKVTAVLVLGFLLWAGWYVYNKGFTRKWRHYVASEFRKRGVEVSIRRLTLDPLQGLVARDVKIVDEKDRDRVLAVISRIVLDVNYANLIQGQPFLNSVDLRGAHISLPLSGEDPLRSPLRIARLSARILLPPQEIVLSQAEADVQGVRISATGRLINPRVFRPRVPDSSEEAAQLRRTVQQILDKLRSFEFRGEAPHIEIRFSGDLSNLETIFAEATLRGRDIRKAGYKINRIEAAATFRDGLVTLSKLTLADQSGKADAVGSFSPASGRAQFQLHSTLDLQGVLSAADIAGVARDFIFYEPPALELTGEINTRSESKVKLLGRIDLGRFGVRSVIFDGFKSNFAWDGQRWFAQDARLVHRSGALSGDALQTASEFRTRIVSKLNLSKLLPLTPGKLAEFLSQWEFEHAPEIDVVAAGPAVAVESLQAEGRIQLGRTRFRDVPLKSAQAKFTLADGALTSQDFRVERAEGVGTGTVTYDFKKREVWLSDVKTALFPADVAMWIEPKLVKDIAPYKFQQPPALAIDGVVQIGRSQGDDLTVMLQAPGRMDYVFLKKTLPFSDVAAALHFTDGKLAIRGATAALYSGNVSGEAEISLKKENPVYSARLEAKNVDFASLTQLYFQYEGSKGLLNAGYDFAGLGDHARAMHGRGNVQVLDGNVFAIPVLGPLSGLLDEIIPGIGYNVARKASCTFEVADGVIKTDDLVVEGRGFSMIGGGKIYFLDDDLDFAIRINAQGMPGVVLFPMSKLLEYAADGPLSDPVWRPKRLPVF
jgi:hypothetical protein